MRVEDYKKIKLKVRALKPKNSLAFLIIAFEILVTSLSIHLSLYPNLLIQIFGGFLFGVSILRWAIINHDTAHDCFFKQRWLNDIFGHLSSVFVILPFYSYRFVHDGHHVWSGWNDLDPDLDSTLPEMARGWRKNVLNFCWKYWIPIFTPFLPFSGYWNIKRLFKIFPNKKQKIQVLSSMLFLVSTYSLLFIFFDLFQLIRLLPGFVVFLIFADPILVAHHMLIPQKRSQGQKVKPFPFYEQDQFARHIVYPKWFARYVFLNFNAHSDHHIFPKLPLYHLHKIHHDGSMNEVNWLDWIKLAKSKTAEELCFMNCPPKLEKS